MMRIRKLRAKGRKDFQAKYINLSYRKRGKVPRTQTNPKASPKKEISNSPEPPKKREVNKKDIKRMLVYSANIIKANPPLEYSVLYPETSSDSPSAKSKGVRLVSAKQEINQIKALTGKRNINHSFS
jgi:hypothetical protein